MVGTFNPVATKLGQQDEGEGPFSPQDLKGDSAQSHPHCTPKDPRTPPQLRPKEYKGTTQSLNRYQTTWSPKPHSQRMGWGQVELVA